MSEKDQGFIERDDPIDDIESTHFERLRSPDYSDEERYPTDLLESLGRMWMKQVDLPGRSERSKKEATTITYLLAFELAYRSDRIKDLEELFNHE